MTNNTTLEGFYNTPASLVERITMGIWLVNLATFSLFGNLFVIFATFKKTAFQLDNASLHIIRSLAAVDALSVIIMIANVTSLVYNRWIFGQIGCEIIVELTRYLGGVEIFTICALNISKITIFVWPLRARARSAQRGQIVSLVFWLVPLLHRVIALAVPGRTVEFQLTNYRCDSSFNTTVPLQRVISNMSSVLFLVLPLIVLLGGTAFLGVYLCRMNGVKNSKVVMLVSVSLTYVFSFLPILIYHFFERANFLQRSPTVFLYYVRYANLPIYISFASNPLIYFLTLKSFRAFLTKRVLAAVGSISIDKYLIRSSSGQKREPSIELISLPLPQKTTMRVISSHRATME